MFVIQTSFNGCFHFSRRKFILKWFKWGPLATNFSKLNIQNSIIKTAWALKDNREIFACLSMFVKSIPWLDDLLLRFQCLTAALRHGIVFRRYHRPLVAEVQITDTTGKSMLYDLKVDQKQNRYAVSHKNTYRVYPDKRNITDDG